jgi:hypothetical protein
MVGRILLGALAALALGLGTFGEPRAQSSSLASLPEWQRDWTVLAMSPDGAWGVATDYWMIGALSRAIRDCTQMSGKDMGCGAYFTVIRAGWSLGIRCGDKNIIMAEPTLTDAERRARWREFELRKLHDPDMPPCVRLVTVDPAGMIVAPNGKPRGG